MAPLSFLKSSSTSSPSRRAESPASQSRNRSPSPEPTSSSRYNPARLLRRKPSSSQRHASQGSRTTTPPLPSMIGPGSEVESSEQETEGPNTASSAFFSDIGDHHVGTPRGLMGEATGDETAFTSPSRILGSPRSKREGGIWSGGGTNLMDTIPDISIAQGPPPWLMDQASPPVSRRIIERSEILLDESAMPDAGPSRLSGRPATPPFSSIDGPASNQPYYPTALSPPRRPMGNTPQPSRSPPAPLAPAISASSSFSAFPPDKRPSHTSSPSLDASSSRPSGHRSTSSQGQSEDLREEPRRPVVTAEWLARKPSSSRLGRKNSTGADSSAKIAQGTTSPFAKRRVIQKSRTRPDAPRHDSDSQSASQDSDSELPAGYVGKRRSISTRDGYEIEVDCDDSRWPGDEDEEGEMVWQVKVRRQPKGRISPPSEQGSTNIANTASPLHLSNGKSTATAPATASSINLSLSLDQPTGKLVFIAFPMDLHATPKRRGSNPRRTTGPGPPTPPLPPSPRDLFSAGAETRDLSTPPSQRITPPPLPTSAAGPSTPPPVLPSTPQSRSSSRLDRPEYPVTPTRVRLSGQFSPAPNSAGNMTSPRSRGASSVARSLSPAFSNGTPGSSGNGYITPGTYTTPTSARRTKLVSAPDLAGGLYARGTVDGLSEELEGASLGPR